MRSTTQIGSGRAVFDLPGDKFINATTPLSPKKSTSPLIGGKEKEPSMDEFANWRRALAGEKQPIYETEPWIGYFAVQDRSPGVKPAKGNRWPLIPCAIWRENGELVAERAGERVPFERVWPFCATRPITHETYQFWHDHERWPDKEKAA